MQDKIQGHLFSIQCPQNALEQCVPRRCGLNTNRIYYELNFLLPKFFFISTHLKQSCKRVHHPMHFIKHSCSQASPTSVVFTLLNRHIIIFGFECYLILKDLLQALIFTIQNKFPQITEHFIYHISPMEKLYSII